MTKSDHQPAWAGVWARIGAFVVDSLVVGAVAYAIGAVAFDAMVRLGLYARLIGLALAVTYFGVLGSRIGGGRTLGKRLLKLRVEDLEGQGLPLGRALVRAFVLSLPFVVNGFSARASGGIATYLAADVAITALFGLGLAQLYLLIFNRPSRRLVHDLLVGSVVLRAGSASVEDVAPTPTLHRRVAFGIIATVFAILTATTFYFAQRLSAPLAGMTSSMTAVEAIPEVRNAAVSDNTTVMATANSGRTTTHTRVVSVQLNAWPKDPEDEAQRIGAAALAADRPAPGWRMVVALNYGFSMGFASGSRTYSTNIPLLPAAGGGR
jgi:uncharacterized RDD family membrane protein YckC